MSTLSKKAIRMLKENKMIKENAGNGTLLQTLKSIFEDNYKETEKEVTGKTFFMDTQRYVNYLINKLNLNQGRNTGYGGFLYNNKDMIIISFAEGDFYLHKFFDMEDYRKELLNAKNFYKNEEVKRGVKPGTKREPYKRKEKKITTYDTIYDGLEALDYIPYATDQGNQLYISKKNPKNLERAKKFLDSIGAEYEQKKFRERTYLYIDLPHDEDRNVLESTNLTESVDFVKKYLQGLVSNGRIRNLKSDEKAPRGFKFLSGHDTAGEVSYNGIKYAYALLPSGKLNVMTSSQAGWNWSETLYKESKSNRLNKKVGDNMIREIRSTIKESAPLKTSNKYTKKMFDIVNFVHLQNHAIVNAISGIYGELYKQKNGEYPMFAVQDSDEALTKEAENMVDTILNDIHQKERNTEVKNESTNQSILQELEHFLSKNSKEGSLTSYNKEAKDLIVKELKAKGYEVEVSGNDLGTKNRFHIEYYMKNKDTGLKESKTILNYDINLAEYIYDNIDVDINRHGYLTFDEDVLTYENVIDYYDDRITKKEFNKTKSIVVKALQQDDLKFYTPYNSDTLIELSDNHTLWQINVPIDDEEYGIIVEQYLEKFTQETGVEVFTEGRSGRHICVHNTVENLIRFEELQTIQQKLESEMIDHINTNYDKENINESQSSIDASGELINKLTNELRKIKGVGKRISFQAYDKDLNYLTNPINYKDLFQLIVLVDIDIDNKYQGSDWFTQRSKTKREINKVFADNGFYNQDPMEDNDSYLYFVLGKKSIKEGVKKMASDLLSGDKEFRYKMLSRLQSDCKYYLGHGNRNPKDLWSQNEKEQIQNMKDLYNSFDKNDKPNWITMDEINKYEKEMVSDGVNEEVEQSGPESKEIKSWYKETYPTDEYGDELVSGVTFKDLFEALDKYKNIYVLLFGSRDGGDSLVRERIFSELSNIMNVSYNDIYDQWLHGDDNDGELVEKLYDKESELYAILYTSEMTDTTIAIIGTNIETLKAHEKDLHDSVDESDCENTDEWITKSQAIVNKLYEAGLIYASTEDNYYQATYNNDPSELWYNEEEKKWYYGNNELNVISKSSSRF